MQRSATHTATQQFPFRRLNAHLTHMPTSAALPATITPRTRAQTHATRQAPPKHNGPGTSASWRVPPKTAHTYKPRTAHRTLTYSIQTHMPRTLTRRPTQPQPLHTETSLHAHRRTHATHRTAHSSDHPTRRPQKITPSRTGTRGLRATLTIVESGCPALTGCCRRVGYCSISIPCRTHDQPSRHSMAPDAAADPASSPQRIAAHQIKSNESQSAHCMLWLTHNTVCE
jgi:hypothetical protein